VDRGACHIVTDSSRLFSQERAATRYERSRLARDLHDGVLQSLTGVILQLGALSRVIELDPQAACKRVREIEELIAEEQRDLRVWIQQLHPDALPSMAFNANLAALLDKLCNRVAWQWDLRVELTVGDSGSGMITRTLGDEVYRLVQEALTNVGRHALARVARVKLEMTPGRLHICISDDGCGFPFRGRFDLSTLAARQLGPESLKGRVACLGGEMVLTSDPSGSQLEITLPLEPRPAEDACSAVA